MNFFDATLKDDAGAVKIETSTFSLALPAEKASLYKGQTGKRVVLGMRPEDIHDASYIPAGIVPARVDANVEVVEQMGNEIILYLEDGGKSFIARTDPRTGARVGNRLGLVFNMDNMHIFDAQSETSLAFDSKKTEAAKAKAHA
jgi:multiple sugar transport system ATP-binding protein